MSQNRANILDESVLESIIANKKGRELFKKLAVIFEKDTLRHLRLIQEYVKRNDHSQLFYELHILKGNAGNLGAVKMLRTCEEMEAKISLKMPKNAQATLNKIEDSYEEVVGILKKKVAGLEAS